MQAGLSDMDDKKVRVVYFTNVPENTCPYILVDDKNVLEIKYHTPIGDGDRHYVDVYYSNGRNHRKFNIESIGFFNPTE